LDMPARLSLKSEGVAGWTGLALSSVARSAALIEPEAGHAGTTELEKRRSGGVDGTRTLSRYFF
jgi:hypothetical protein